jgi:hypothetical protein
MSPPALEAAIQFSTSGALIPLFERKKQQKPLIPTLCRPNVTLQVVDSVGVRHEFPYAAEQRNLAAEQRNWFG